MIADADADFKVRRQMRIRIFLNANADGNFSLQEWKRNFYSLERDEDAYFLVWMRVGFFVKIADADGNFFIV